MIKKNPKMTVGQALFAILVFLTIVTLINGLFVMLISSGLHSTVSTAIPKTGFLGGMFVSLALSGAGSMWRGYKDVIDL